MQNHQQRHHEPPPSSRKPPLLPPTSISQPSSTLHPPPRPEPTTRSTEPDSPNSPDSPRSTHQFGSPENQPPPSAPPAPSSPSLKNGGQNLSMEKYYSPRTSPFPVTPPNDVATIEPHHQVVSFFPKEVAPPLPPPRGGGGGERKKKVRFDYDDVGRNTGSLPEKGNVDVVKKVALGIRVLEVAFCLVSFSVMATDKSQGWSGDSFSRYKEYRFCLTVNIIGFVYSAFQAYDLAYHLPTGKHVINHHLRYHFEFIMDQIMAYLLISASSASATRVVDWELNWGKDEFTEKASVSISMAFLAFFAFAMSSLISGNSLCNRDVS